METPHNHRGMRQGSLAVVFALAGLLLTAGPASGQVIWIAPDRSIVNIGPPRVYPVTGTFTVNPVVVSGNRFVRVGGGFSATMVTPRGTIPGTGFIRPFYANDRGSGANFPGSPLYNPNPIVTGPFQRWWP